jgi:hypothetical protein
MPRIKVGLDEWIIATTGHDVELVTDGLSGCVAVILDDSDDCLLAHVFSACNEGNFDAYKTALDVPLQTMGDGIYVTLVRSEENDTWLSTNLKGWLKAHAKVNGNSVEVIKSAGVGVSGGGAKGWDAYLKRTGQKGNVHKFVAGYINSAASGGVAGFHSSGFLSASGKTSG